MIIIDSFSTDSHTHLKCTSNVAYESIIGYIFNNTWVTTILVLRVKTSIFNKAKIKDAHYAFIAYTTVTLSHAGDIC